MTKSESALVFAREGGGMQLESADLCELLRSALNRAHIVDGWILKCGRCRNHIESQTPDTSPCPK